MIGGREYSLVGAQGVALQLCGVADAGCDRKIDGIEEFAVREECLTRWILEGGALVGRCVVADRVIGDFKFAICEESISEILLKTISNVRKFLLTGDL